VAVVQLRLLMLVSPTAGPAAVSTADAVSCASNRLLRMLAVLACQQQVPVRHAACALSECTGRAACCKAGSGHNLYQIYLLQRLLELIACLLDLLTEYDYSSQPSFTAQVCLTSLHNLAGYGLWFCT
jgi:hypothetical protein